LLQKMKPTFPNRLT